MTAEYYKYLKSQEWYERAEAAKARAGQRCQVCNKSRDEITLDAHHRTYERLGNELPEDITVLCRDCHNLYERNRILVSQQKAQEIVITPVYPSDKAGSKYILVSLPRTDDIERGRRRLRRVYGLLNSYPGDDIFELQVMTEAGGYKVLKFPGKRTGVCQDMLHLLDELLGPENYAVRSL